MKFHQIKGKHKKEIDEVVDYVLMTSLRETMDMVADLYLEENILISYFRDGNDQYQASFKDYNMSSSFHKDNPYMYIPLTRNNEEDKPMCVTYDTLEEALIDMLISAVEHIERMKQGHPTLPKIREGDKTKLDDELLIENLEPQKSE